MRILHGLEGYGDSGFPIRDARDGNTQYLSPRAYELGEKSLSASWPPGQPVATVFIC